MTGISMGVMSDDEVASYGRDPHARYGALTTLHGALPLVAMDIDARVAGVVASIDVAQTFVNATPWPVEATYIFPLPDRAAVFRFHAEIAGRTVEGMIEERGAARDQYDQAIAAGHRAAIAEEDRAGVFTVRVGNLLPGERAVVRLSLVGPLPVDDGEVTFRFPLVVAPRYTPGAELGGEQAGAGTARDTDLVPDASRISPPVVLPGCPNPVRLALRVALTGGVMRDVASSLHAVTERKQDAQIIEVVPGERLDRDFILRWRIDGDELRSSLVCLDDAGGYGGTFALTVVPPSTTAIAAKPRDVVFVIDRSGSMEGWKMIAARRAAARMIDTLTSRDRFCAITFSSGFEQIPAAGLVAATDRERFRAVEALAKVTADGGTEMAQPLAVAVALLLGQEASRERTIVLVTDGQVSNEDHILGEVSRGLRGTKMFALGIDQAVNAAFLRRLAAAGGGLCELVESEDRLDDVMTKVHRRIGTPIATELAIHVSGMGLDTSSLPDKLPDAYAGAPVVVLGRYHGAIDAAKARIELTGTTLGEPLKVSLAATLDTSPHDWLAASWARQRIRVLEDRYAVQPSSGLSSEIVSVSKRFGVLSRFTAFVAVDRDRVIDRPAPLHAVVQPVERTAARTLLAGPPSGWKTAIAGMPAGMTMLGRAAPGPMDEMAPPAPPNGVQRIMKVSSVAPPVRARIPTPPNPVATIVAGALGGPSTSSGPADVTEYRKQLVELAGDLTRSASQLAAARLVQQRLSQCLEDLRSVGGDAALTKQLEEIIERLARAFAKHAGDPSRLARELGEIAQKLAELGGSAPTPPPKKSRLAFWK